MLATTTNLNRFLNKAERIIRNDYNEEGLIVCARIDNVFAINYNGIPFILSVNVAPFNVIVYSIALSSDSKNYIIKSRGTCGNQEDVINDIYVDLLHYVRDNNICLETAEKHYDDYTSEDFINAGIAKECTECPDFCEEDCIENAECARGNDVFDGCKQKPPKGHIYVDTDSVKVAPLPEQQTSEESIKDTVIADDTIAYQNARVKETKPTVLNVMQCMMCPADREGNRCCGEQWCKQTWKRYGAIVNLEWHHVSLATLANIDNDMLDAKRRNYMYLYNLIKDFRKYAFEIIRKDVYFETTSNVFRNIQQLYFNNVISFTTYDYAAKHIQAVGVEKGWFDSKSEETFGYKESRRYKVTLR